MTQTSQIVELVKRPSATTFWICYRCNLTFHEESAISLHNEITNHSVRKIEFSQAKETHHNTARYNNHLVCGDNVCAKGKKVKMPERTQ